jgi:hypothetical protein
VAWLKSLKQCIKTPVCVQNLNLIYFLFHRKYVPPKIVPFSDPITSISSSDTIEFLCAANSGVYTDLASSYLYVKAKITTAAGGNVGADIQVGPSNLWMHALFSLVEVFLNNKLVTPIKHSLPLPSVYRNDPEL